MKITKEVITLAFFVIILALLFAVVLNSGKNRVLADTTVSNSNSKGVDGKDISFKLRDYTVNVRDKQFGAIGDGKTNDTEAIQKAIDYVNKSKGGTVLLPKGYTFAATCIKLKSNVNLLIDEGAVLQQSSNPKHYTYKPAYGHDGNMPGINWAHNMHVSNYPLIYATNVSRVKITGKGIIKMMEATCKNTIHLVPIGLYKVDSFEISDINIRKASNYHICLYFTKKRIC